MNRLKTVELVMEKMVNSDGSMNERQLRIHSALQGRREELAAFYRTALRLLSGDLDVPDPRTRVAFVGHCMRELMNRVLGAWGRPTAPRFKPPSGDQVRALPDLLARFPELELDREGDSVPVPREVAMAMDRLFKAAVHEKGRVRDDVAAFITDDNNASHVAVSQWIDSQRFFVKWTHLSDHDVPEADLPSEAELRRHVDVFEELLDGVITAFFTSLHSIEDLLGDINAVVEDRDA